MSIRKPMSTRKAICPKTLRKGLKPRDRLIERGPQSLTNAELIAVVLRHRSDSDRHKVQLEESGGLTGLFTHDLESMIQRGFNEAQAAVLLAVAELSRRQARQDVDDIGWLDDPKTVARYLYLQFHRADQEVLGAIYIDLQNRVLGETETFRGTLTRAAAEPRALIRRALTLHAAGMILFHTHPGGSPEPSTQDIQFTTRVYEAGQLLGITVVDHIIVGHEGAYVSLMKRGKLPARSYRRIA